MRRVDDMREATNELLKAQQRARVRRAVFAGKSGNPSRAPRSTGQIMVGRVGLLLLTTAIGGAIGALTGTALTGAALGFVLGVVLGSLVAR